MASDTYGSSNAQLSTRKRAKRGSGCSSRIAVPIMNASHGKKLPAWFETSSARPWLGTLRMPSTSTRHQRL
jgi:hypothetical protein